MIEKLVSVIESRGLKQAAVERLAGLSENRISKWKDGKGEPTARQMLRLADLLRVPVRFLLDDEMCDPGVELDEAQKRILWLADQVGYDLAVQRLTVVPETKKPPVPVEPEEGARVSQRKSDRPSGRLKSG